MHAVRPGRLGHGLSAVAGTCKINGKCHAFGELEPGGCGVCDPTVAATSWSPLPGRCRINGVCRQAGDTDASGCATCAPSTSTTTWTAVSGASATTEGFEKGASGWTITNGQSSVGWGIDSQRAAAGKQSLRYGDPASGDYDNGARNSGIVDMPQVALTAGKKASLTFDLYMDTESSSKYDVLEVQVGGSTVWTKDVTQSVTMQKWISVVIDLSAHAGQTIQVRFSFDTMDSTYNSGEGVYIDNVNLMHGC